MKKSLNKLIEEINEEKKPTRVFFLILDSGLGFEIVFLSRVPGSGFGSVIQQTGSGSLYSIPAYPPCIAVPTNRIAESQPFLSALRSRSHSAEGSRNEMQIIYNSTVQYSTVQYSTVYSKVQYT